CFFFFQAEDGIRDLIVTGVQTCALPISAGSADDANLYLGMNALKVQSVVQERRSSSFAIWFARSWKSASASSARPAAHRLCASGSEERRVGKECSSRWPADTANEERQRR